MLVNLTELTSINTKGPCFSLLDFLAAECYSNQ